MRSFLMISLAFALCFFYSYTHIDASFLVVASCIARELLCLLFNFLLAVGFNVVAVVVAVAVVVFCCSCFCFPAAFVFLPLLLV